MKYKFEDAKKQVEDLLEKLSVPNKEAVAVEITLLFRKMFFESTRRVVTWEQLIEMRNDYNFGYTFQQLSKKYNCSVGSVQDLLKYFN